MRPLRGYLRRTTRCTCSTPPGVRPRIDILRAAPRCGSLGRHAGRSRPLDFAAPGSFGALGFGRILDGVEIDGFAFAIENLGDDGRRGDLKVETPFGHRSSAPGRAGPPRPELEPETLDPVRLPVHDRYDFTLQPDSGGAIRGSRLGEARALPPSGPWSAPLRSAMVCNLGHPRRGAIRRLWCSGHRDIVVDGRGTKPVDSAEVCSGREMPPSSAGGHRLPHQVLSALTSGSQPVAAGTPSSPGLDADERAGSSATSEISTRSTRHWHR